MSMTIADSGLRWTVWIRAGMSWLLAGPDTAAGTIALAAFTPHSDTAGALSFMNLIARSARRRLLAFSAMRAVAMAAFSRTSMFGLLVSGCSALAAARE